MVCCVAYVWHIHACSMSSVVIVRKSPPPPEILSAGHGIQPQAPLPAVSPAQQLQQGAPAAAAASSASPPAVSGGGVPAGAVPTSPAQSLAANLSSQVR